MSDLTLLSNYLRAAHPGNVIIPCGRGDKRPYFPYKSGWTWADFDAVMAATGSMVFDWAIILHDLCVIDCDSPEAASDLEERFPCVREAPSSRTKKGLHFYFKRSSLADSGGYFDCSGCAQVATNVDFKSITILVAPSTDKEWIRALWSTPLTPIPDSLLTSVARPHAKNDDDKSTLPVSADPVGDCAFDPEHLDEAILTFEDDGGEGDESGWRITGARLKLLRSFDYCGSLLSGRWAIQGSHGPGAEPGNEVPRLGMPCKRAVLEEIFALYEKGELTQTREPTDTLLALVEATADMLGCPPRTINPLLERAAYVADLHKISPLWWALHRDEQRRMLGTSAAESDRALVLVDNELAEVTGYSPMAKEGESWLFPTLPHLLNADREHFKVFVDSPAETTFEQMPPPVIEILTQHAACAVVAGGAVLGGVTRYINHGSDIDLFLHGLDRDGSTAVLSQARLPPTIEDLMQSERYKDVYDVSRSNAAITYTKKDSRKASKEESAASTQAWLHDRPFQVILGLHRSRSQILEYFDIACCKALARIADAETPMLVVEALPTFVESVRRNAFFVDTLYWSPASVARISKYIAKGFECAVPGVRRAAFGVHNHEPKREYSWPKGHNFPMTTTLVELTPKEKRDADDEMLETREIEGYCRSSSKGGLASLFDMEAEVIRSRAYMPHPKSIEAMVVEKIDGRLKPVEAATIASKLAGKLGRGQDPNWKPPPRPEYDDDGWGGDGDFYGCFGGGGPGTNTYGFIREPFRCDVAVRIGDARRNIPLSTNFWAFTDAGRFQPAKAFVEHLYNPEKLSAIAALEAAARAEELAGAEDDELEYTLCAFDEGALHDLYDQEGGPFDLINERLQLGREMAEEPVPGGSEVLGADEPELATLQGRVGTLTGQLEPTLASKRSSDEAMPAAAAASQAANKQPKVAPRAAGSSTDCAIDLDSD